MDPNDDSINIINSRFRWSDHLQCTTIDLDSPSTDYRLVYTDKVNLPSSALNALISQQIGDSMALPSPLTFKLTNIHSGQYTFVGVREFSAPEGSISVPEPIYHEIGAEPFSEVAVEFQALPKGTAVTFQSLEDDGSVDDWKVLLEHRLHSSYTSLREGREITVIDPTDSSRIYRLKVDKLEPAGGVCIVDTDLSLDILPVIEGGKIVPRKLQSNGSPVFMDLTIDEPLVADIPAGSTVYTRLNEWDRSKDIDFLISGFSAQVFVGVDEDATNPHSFLWSNVEDPMGSRLTIHHTNTHLSTANKLFIIVKPLERKVELCIRYTISENGVKAGPSATTMPPNFKLCDNCHQHIMERSFTLHSAFCQRNNILCEKGCEQVFARKEGIPSSHWHCDQCLPGIVSGNSHEQFDAHIAAVHTPMFCSCGDQFPSLVPLALHKATTCPQKFIICQFCHLKLPQESASPQDILQNLTGHESYCGNRTTDCDICNRVVRLRDLRVHMEFHDKDRLATASPLACLNSNCPRTLNSVNFEKQAGLCSICFGPLHSTVNDPTGAKLNQRIERRYVIQLTRGCNKSWCMNKYCAAGNVALKQKKMPEIMKICQDLKQQQKNSFFFCVDETATKRNLFIEFERQQSDYSRAWLAKAIEEARGNEKEARKWLQFNAVKQSEVLAH